jgi:ribonucleoside-triphosphate reductase
MKVIKRSGDSVEFDFEKIRNAVNKAFNSVHGTDAPDDFLDYLQTTSSTFETDLNVEDIQRFVIYSLGEFKYYDVQIAYTEYRYKHAEERLIKDRILYMKNYQLNGENAATSSASDPNANMNLKNVANMESEVYKLENRKTQRIMLYDEITKLYGKPMADQYLKDLTSHLIYSHDEASTPVIKNYCEAVTLYPLLEGTDSLDGTGTRAPKHLDSFCGQLVNATFLLASQCKGAVAFGEFFNFFDYFAVKDYGENYDLDETEFVDNPVVVKHPKTIGDRIEQQFQYIVCN